MRISLMMLAVLFTGAATMACEGTTASVEAAQVAVPAPRAGQGVGEPSPEGAYDVAIIRIAGEHELATDRCDPLTARLRVDCKARADRQREASSNRARKARDLARR